MPAFSLGLFVAFMPFPGHALVAALMALVLRVNIPVSAISTLVSNPLTIGPMFYLAYLVGLELLGAEPQPFDIELSFAWLGDQFLVIWLPLLIGCLLLGSLLSLVGYIALDLVWRASLADYVAARRRRRENSD